jgi:hypothetical protein
MAVEYFSNVKVVGTGNTYNKQSGTCLMVYNTATGKYEALSSNGFGGSASGFGNKTISGAIPVALDSQIATELNILNNTGTDLKVVKNSAFIIIPTGVSLLVTCITNATQISVSRNDGSATPVTFYYVWQY